MKISTHFFSIKNSVLCFSIFLSLGLSAQNVQLEWASASGGAGFDAGQEVVTDAAGNVYTTGYFVDTADFDPGAGTANLISNGADDIFVQKLDANGDFVWAKAFGGSLLDLGYSIAVDTLGNVYTTGLFNDTVDFDPGPDTANLISNGFNDVFISKLDPNGNFVWAKAFGGGNSFDEGNSIAVDGAGNVYTTGFFGATVDFDPGPGTVNLTANGSTDIFISKLDSNGNFVWAKAFGGISFDVGNAITLDETGNIYTTGYFGNTADFDPGTNTSNLTSNGGEDIFISKLDVNGDFIWAKALGGSSGDRSFSIAVDGNGNVYSTGYFQGTADFDPSSSISNLTANGATDIFISKLDSNGAFVWANSSGGTSNEFAYSIAVDGTGNIYTTGTFRVTVDFDPGSGTSNLTSNGSRDIFISKLDSNGAFVWAEAFGGGINDDGNSIAVDGAGNVYTTGYFVGAVDFDPGASTSNLISNGSGDIFIQKLSQQTIASLESNLVSDLSFQVFPNPASSVLNLPSEMSTDSQISVFNFDGKVVMQTDNKQQISIHHLERGLYFIAIEKDNQVYRTKFMKN